MTAAAQFRSDAALKAARARKAKDRRLRRKYGITLAQYDAILRSQGGVCKLCGRPPRKLALAVDHDHKTHRVRGLLCFTCNHFHVAKNTAATARRMIPYLESTYDGRTT